MDASAPVAVRPGGGSVVRRKSSGLLSLGRPAAAPGSLPHASPPVPDPAVSSAPPSGPATTASSVAPTLAKRMRTWAYLRRANEGQVHWFNTSLLQREDLDAALAAGRLGGTSARFAVLGMSLASLLELSNSSSSDFLKGLLALSIEFDALVDGATIRPKARSLFRPARGPRRSGAAADAIGSDASEYSYLTVPNMPFEPDYFQTLYTMCDILVDIYARLLACLGSPSATAAPSSGSTAEIIARIDARLKKLIWPICKELDALARSIISSELGSLADDGLGDWGLVDA